ncbi:MAG: hypothetical protein KDE09_23295 [Anaerolineales bacterium]|nr:hypothetical protein [Anaerolineales bacterium]MCB0014824.1 hypothetical protein [Anaerolineales bacterium]MCB0020747.1 hypothetical protein [Anaerolineales bacterium]MCB0028280.1 hypothetical protein [Anaerolineales bacterium]MCB8958696.1 hypothetical protein [Ardenticatenales bacterium]
MNKLITIGVVLIQAVVGQILGFGLAFALGIGNGWELVIMPVGNIVGVWGVGMIAAKLHGAYAAKPFQARLVGTALGSVIGVVILLVTPAIGYVQVLFPLLGALLGFYLSVRTFPKRAFDY